MLTTKQENKLRPIINSWTLGNIFSASERIRKLTKLELALLLTQACVMHELLTLPREQHIRFEDFIIRTLEG